MDKAHQAGAAEYRALLMKLRGVYAAGIRMEENGAIREIHILADESRNPKQLVRDAQSALMAVYALAVDHRIISIAQISGETAPHKSAAEASRLCFQGLTESLDGDRYAIAVRMTGDGGEFCGHCECHNDRERRFLAAATAACEAINGSVGVADAFHVLNVEKTRISGCDIALVLLNAIDGTQTHTLIGAAQMTSGDEKTAIVQATLDAANHCIGQ